MVTKRRKRIKPKPPKAMTPTPLKPRLPQAFSASNVQLPQMYEAAKLALAECERIDECKDWADKAEALASYAKQAKDPSLRRMADRIQARAVRRSGELLREIEPGQGKYQQVKSKQGTKPRKVIEVAVNEMNAPNPVAPDKREGYHPFDIEYQTPRRR